MTDGIILIDKPAGMTSFGVVARIRRVLTEKAGKKVKVGHTGTLDPFATGLLILCIGKECRNAGDYMKKDKVYEATVRLGQTSTTGDPEGEIEDSAQGDTLSRHDVEEVLKQFVGPIEQIPPMHSAVKINGQRAYKLARKGEEIEMPARKVTIYSMEMLEYNYPDVKIRVNVSSGTYIRSLAIDIGAKLGTGAYCKELRRISIDKRSVTEAKTLADFGVTG